MQMSTPANMPLKFEKIVIWTAIGLQDGSALDAVRSSIYDSRHIEFENDIIVLSCEREDYDYQLVQVARPKFTPVQEDSQATVTMDTLNDTMDKLTDMAESMKGGE